MKTCLLLLISISGAMGQTLPCPTFTTDRNACASANIGSLNAIRDLFFTVNQVYSASIFLTSSSTVCANQAAVKAFMTCMSNAARACVPSGFHKSLQTTQQLLDGVDYLCTNIANLDVTCYTNGASNLGGCITAATNNHGHNLTVPDEYFKYVCLYSRSTAICLKSTYPSCSKPNTGTILQAGMDKQLPQACDGVVSSVSMILLLAVTLMNVIT